MCLSCTECLVFIRIEVWNKTNVAKIRKERGWTQEELAEKSYLTVRTIQRMEAGKDVSLTSLSSVAKALHVSVSDLFEDIEEEQKEVQVMEFSQELERQKKERRAEKSTMTLLTCAVLFLFLMLTGYPIGQLRESKQAFWGSVWIACLFLAMASLIYFNRIIWSRHLDRKYPKTVGYDLKRHGQEPIQNGWQFAARYW